MSISLYEVSIATSKQTLDGVSSVLKKARKHFESTNENLDEVAACQLTDDMLGFGFQVVSVVHHSLGSIQGVYSGEFRPPEGPYDLSWENAEQKIKDARNALSEYSEDDVNAQAGKRVEFVLGEQRIPFESENFVLSFSHPNLFFHATTAYDLLRMKGVPLSKRDFMGPLRLAS
ncbi:MAG: DUF1993 family protein [Lysobacterales bacterium]